jgi:hypothetical protein
MARRDREFLDLFPGEPAAAGGDFDHDGSSELATHESVVMAVLRSRGFSQEHWRLVVNGRGRSIFGIAHGLYPDVVALDGSDSGVAWALEVATPSAIVDEGSWERWGRIAATGISFILTVPFGAGVMTERAAELLDVRAGLVYEYGVTPDRVFFSLPARGGTGIAA